nr:reverse transcriptase domain-containing protein [Tanacetum cinerariifolium]
MRTRSNFYSSNSTANIPRRSNRRHIPNIVELEIQTIAEIILMADRTMEELLQAPTEGYGEAIVILEILVEIFEIKMNLLQDVLIDAIKLMLFPYSLEDRARIWYEKEPPNSILTWDDLVNKFVNQFFPPSKTTHLKNEISRFTKRFKETFSEAWDRFKELLRDCPHHEFSELTQIDTFYNGLTEQDQDSLNAASGGNLLNKTTRESLQIIENKSKVRYSRSKSNVSKVNTNSRDVVSKTDDQIDKLADQISNLVKIVNKQVIAPAKAVEKTYVTCGGAHAYYECIATDSNPSSVCAATGSYNQVSPPNRASHQIPPHGFAPVQNNSNRFNQNQGQGNYFNQANNFSQGNNFRGNNFQNNQGYRAQMNNVLNFQNQDEQNTEEILDKEHSNSSRSTAQVLHPIVPILILEPDVLGTQSKPLISYPCRLNDQKLREKATNQMEKFFQIFHDLHFDISFVDALFLMPKFASTIKSLLVNKDKLFELAKVPLNENCLAMLLKKLSEKLGDLGKFLIPCDFPRMEVCHALADLGASINLMPLSIWKKLSLPELTPTQMTLELADRSITCPKGVAEDVCVMVGKFHLPTDFVMVDFEADPRVPLILGRSFLRTGHTLIDVYGEEITLRVNDESITFNLSQTMRYSSTCDDTLVNRVDIIDVSYEDFVQAVLDFQYNPKSSSPTLVSDDLISESNASKVPIVKSSSLTLTLFGEIEKLLNENSCSLSPMDIKVAKESKEKSSVEEPPELELKELPSHLEYVFLEDSNKLPVIIAKNLKVDEREALINVLKSHKRAIAWKIFDIKGIDPRFYTHKILMEDNYKPAVQSQNRPVVSPIHCVPKMGGMTVVVNKNNELIPTRLVTGWRGISKLLLIHKTKKKILSHALMEPSRTDACSLACVMPQDAKPRLLRWVLLLQEFDITILDKKGFENLAADHLSRPKNPHQDVLENKDINENFPLETLGSLTSHNTPCV